MAAAPHGHQRAAKVGRYVTAPAWNDLPDTMQLLVVKEMTSWQSYESVIDQWLHLTWEQKCRFEAMYRLAIGKTIHADHKALATNDVILRTQGRAQAHVGIPGRLGSGSSGSTDSGIPRTYALIGALTKDAQVLDQAANPFSVSYSDIAVAQAFLRSIAFVQHAADLGHWMGHSGSQRFIIDEDTHLLCPLGTHAMPDEEPVPLGHTGNNAPLRVSRQPQRNPWVPQQPAVSPPVLLSQPQIPLPPTPVPQPPLRRRGRPPRARPLPEGPRPSSNSSPFLDAVSEELAMLAFGCPESKANKHN